MQIHELDTFTGTPGSGDWLAIDNGTETTKISAEEFIPEVPDNTPVGTITMFGGSTAPPKWVLCDGRAISRTAYADLFQVIGTTYGSGNGSTTFNVPDMRNRFPVGAGDQYSRNSKGGSKEVTLSTNQIPAHTHGKKSLSGTLSTRRIGQGDNPNLWGSGIVSMSRGTTAMTNAAYQSGFTYKGDDATIDASHEHNSVGGGASHENRPPYIGINFIIFSGV